MDRGIGSILRADFSDGYEPLLRALLPGDGNSFSKGWEPFTEGWGHLLGWSPLYRRIGKHLLRDGNPVYEAWQDRFRTMGTSFTDG